MAEATITAEEIPAQAGSKAILFTISGQLDESNVDDRARDVYKILDENTGKLSLVFDLAGLDYMNSKSIGYLTDWYGKIKERGGEVVIARAKPNILDILQVVGLTQLIKTFESVDEAKQAVLQSGGAQTAGAEPTAPAVPTTQEPPVAQAEPPAPTETPEAPAPAEPQPEPQTTPTEAPPVQPPVPLQPPAENKTPEQEQPAAPEAPAQTEPTAPPEPQTPEAQAPAQEGGDTFNINA